MSGWRRTGDTNITSHLGGLGSSLERDRQLSVLGCIRVTLHPRVDDGATGKDSVARKPSNSNSGTSEVNVVENQGTTADGNAVGRESSDHSLGGVGELAVRDQDRSDSLVLGRVRHVETDLAVVDVERLEGPQPVPVHEDGRVAVVEGHVAGGELLVAQEHAVVSTVESQVGHEATGAVVHEDTHLLVGITASLDHLKANVLQAGSLSNLPVDTGSGALRHSREIDNEVANRAEEVVLVGVPVGTVIVVRVGVDNSNTLESRSGLQSGNIERITNHLGVVVLDDGLGDNIGTGWEVNQSRSNSGRVAVFSTAVARRDSLVNGIGVISGAIT